MKIELKNIKIALHLSQETIAFTANLYVDGKLVASCHNTGNGGMTMIQSISVDTIKIVMELDKYCKALPPIDLGGGTTIPCTLDAFVDDMIDKYLAGKEKARMDKLMLNSIVIGDEGGYVHIKLPYPISELLAHPMSKDGLKNTIQKHLKEVCRENPDFRLLNTNIPDEIVRQLQVN